MCKDATNKGCDETCAESNEDDAVGAGAEGECEAVVADHDEPPDGQNQRVPCRHRVVQRGEIHVEEQEQSPGIRILKMFYLLYIDRYYI